MGNILADLGKSLFSKNSARNTASADPANTVQSRCPECEYSSEAYDIDAYCAECDGQSHFRPREEQEISEVSSYERILELLPELSGTEKARLVEALQESLAETEEQTSGPGEEPGN